MYMQYFPDLRNLLIGQKQTRQGDKVFAAKRWDGEMGYSLRIGPQPRVCKEQCGLITLPLW